MSGFYPFLMSIFFSNQSLHPLVFMGLTKPSLLSSNKKSNKKNHSSKAFLIPFPYGFLTLLYLLHFRHLKNERSLFVLDTIHQPTLNLLPTFHSLRKSYLISIFQVSTYRYTMGNTGYLYT